MTQLFEDNTAVISIQAKPAWMSDELWDTLTRVMDAGRLSVEFSFSRAERKILRKKKPIKVSDWAEKHRVLIHSARPGIWHNDVTPYLPGIMDAADLPFVREINICATPQTGKSECVHNFVGKSIDRDPGPVLYVYPDEKTTIENSKDRVLPMIKASPRLRSYFTGLEKDKSSYRINLQHVIIHFGWAGSIASLANKAIRYAVADEIDKPGFDAGKKETGKLELIDKRLTTYRSISKFFKISTPTVESGNIWIALAASDVIFDYLATCPLCGMMQLMSFKGIKWEGGSGADPKEIKNKNLAWYECEHCQGKWDEVLKSKAVGLGRGVWMAREISPDGQVSHRIELFTYLEKFRPAVIGFHLPAWISNFVTFGEIAAAFLLGLNDLVKHQDFLNSYCALPWKHIFGDKLEDEILALKNHLPAGVVPAEAVALTCGVDVQKFGFWFVVRSWTADLTSHLVQYGFLTTWDDVETLIFGTRYPVEGKPPGSTMGIWRAGIDSGGGKDSEEDWSKTEEVYHWVRKNGRGVVFATKGASTAQVKKVTPKTIDKMARGNRVIPGGLVLYFLDTNQFKDLFHWRMGREASESQHMTLNADTGVDYARQILAERKEKDRSGKTEWVQHSRANHLFDCENMAAACADPEWMPSLSFMTTTQGRGRRVINSGVSNAD